jgi:hypothetical protein
VNNRNQQDSKRTPSIQLTPPPSSAPAPTTPTHLNVFTVEEYETNGKTQKRWTRIGTAFPHKEGPGFSASNCGRFPWMEDWLLSRQITPMIARNNWLSG